MYKINIKSNNTSKTLRLGKSLSKLLTKGDIVVLSGELGSGKTKFVEGFLQNYGLENEIIPGCKTKIIKPKSIFIKERKDDIMKKTNSKKTETKKAIENSVKTGAMYFDMNNSTPEEVMEEFFEEEERARIQEKLDEGYEIACIWDENTTDEEFLAMMQPFLDKME